MLDTSGWKPQKGSFSKLLIGMSAALLILATAFAGQEKLVPPSGVIPPTLFGMHIHRFATTTPWPTVKFGAIRLWDSYAAWPYVEPTKGKWNFSGVDKYVAEAERTGVEVLLPLGLSPNWASSRPDEKSGYSPGNAAYPVNLLDWRDYVRTVGIRYKGRVHYYEIWNEPNSRQFWTGDSHQLSTLVDEASKILKEVDASNMIISPAASGASALPWFEEFIKLGGTKHADIIGYHFYVNPAQPEEMVSLIQSVKNILAKYGQSEKPIWNTETGWAIQNFQKHVDPTPGKGFNSVVLSQEEASAYIARAYILTWATDVSRLYWYSWDNGVMGLTDADGKTLKPAAKAYEVVEGWLVGARMISCGSNAERTWICQVSRAGGYGGWIIWNPDLRTQFEIPKTWGVKNLRDLAGGSRSLQGVNRIEISFVPVMLERPAE